MKNKILTFIIGVLIGAIITTGAFYFYAKNINLNKNRQIPEMLIKENGGRRPNRSEDFEGQNPPNFQEMPLNNRETI